MSAILKLVVLCLLASLILPGLPGYAAAPVDTPENIKIIRCQLRGFFIPQVSGISDYRLQGKINRELRNAIASLDEPERYNNLYGDFEVTFYNGNLLGIHFIGDTYRRRAAHPNKIDFGIHVDLTTGSRYELSDLFREGVDFKDRIKELCRTNEANYRLTSQGYGRRWTWDGWTYDQFTRSWSEGRFLLAADSLRVYDSLNFATGYFSGYRVPLADLADIVNTGGSLWKALKSREPMPVSVELEQLDIDDFHVREYNIKPGDDVSWLTMIMGQPRSKTQVPDGVCYRYDELEVIVGPRDKIINILTDNQHVSTRRWVHAGLSLKVVKDSYGEDAITSSSGEYDLYEYVYYEDLHTPKTKYVLRFAAKMGTEIVSYIGWRIAEP